MTRNKSSLLTKIPLSCLTDDELVRVQVVEIEDYRTEATNVIDSRPGRFPAYVDHHMRQGKSRLRAEMMFLQAKARGEFR